ncbi:MAG: SbcC/MukB-like Walker B domain-containing protein, partial [Patulibacter sp.]
AALAAADRALVAADRDLAATDAQLAALVPHEFPARHAALDDTGTTLDAQEQEIASETAALEQAAALHEATILARRTAAEEVARCRMAEQQSERQLAELTQRLAGASASAGGLTPHQAQADLDGIDAEIARLDRRIAETEQARERVAALEAEIERQRTRSGQARTAAARHRQHAESQRAEADRLDAELRQLRGPLPTVEAAALAAERFATAMEGAVTLLTELGSATIERDRAAQHLAERLAAVPAAARPAPGSSLAERLRQQESQRQQARDAASAAERHLAEARRRLDAIDQAAAALDRLNTELGPVTAEAERITRLDATVRGGGDNQRKISLATYVLAARLEQVAAAATTHLLRMSSGRYELVHHDDRYGGGPAGLGLRVRDGWTGEERDTATLSGGEAFYASLALALGLAEAVTSEAGGRPLDTLLVDEGFGSLDADTLEEVLGVLDELRAGGRAVGLVSHVAALAERIPSQLRVTPARSGSRAEVHLSIS